MPLVFEGKKIVQNGCYEEQITSFNIRGQILWDLVFDLSVPFIYHQLVHFIHFSLSVCLLFSVTNFNSRRVKNNSANRGDERFQPWGGGQTLEGGTFSSEGGLYLSRHYDTREGVGALI